MIALDGGKAVGKIISVSSYHDVPIAVAQLRLGLYMCLSVYVSVSVSVVVRRQVVSVSSYHDVPLRDVLGVTCLGSIFPEQGRLGVAQGSSGSEAEAGVIPARPLIPPWWPSGRFDPKSGKLVEL